MVWGTSAELGDPEPTFGNPIGLVLERRTVPDLKTQKQRMNHRKTNPSIK